MKKLTSQDWSLIARFLLKEESTPADTMQVNALMNDHPGLKAQLETLDHDFSKNHHQKDIFDAEAAFEKIHKQLEEENLI